MKSFVALPDNSEAVLEQKLENSKKMRKNYEKEAERLKFEVEQKTGYDKVIELENKLYELEKKSSDMQKNNNELQKKVSVTAKEIALFHQKKTEGIFQNEEKSAIIMLNQAREKTNELNESLKNIIEAAKGREEKIKKFTQNVEELTKELDTIKKEFKPEESENPKNLSIKKEEEKKQEKKDKKSIEEIKSEIENVKDEIEETAKKNKDQKLQIDKEIEKLKEQLKALEKVNGANTHKILEINRIQKLQRQKMHGTPVLQKLTEKEKKIEAGKAKLDKMKKYNKLAIVRKASLPSLDNKEKNSEATVTDSNTTKNLLQSKPSAKEITRNDEVNKKTADKGTTEVFFVN